MEEVQRLCGQGDEKIRKNWQHAGRPDWTNQHQSPPDGADLHVAKREADGDVALDRHAGQVQRGVFSGDQSHQDEGAADRDAEFVDGVADNEQGDGQRHLDHVIDDQVNEKDVARIRVEDLEDERKQHVKEDVVWRPLQTLDVWVRYLTVQVRGLGEHPHLHQRINQRRWELLADWSSWLKGSAAATSRGHPEKNLKRTG